MRMMMVFTKPGGWELHWSEELGQGGIGWSPERRLAPAHFDQNAMMTMRIWEDDDDEDVAG